MPKDDLTLVKDTLAGYQAAFGELVHRWQGGIFNFVKKMIYDHEEAKDLTQEVFLKCYRSLASYNPEFGKFSTWLFKIAQNTCIDHLRARKNWMLTESLDASEDDETQRPLYEKLASEAPDPLMILEERATKQAINQILTEIPDLYRAVIILRQVENYDYEEISKILDIPVGTVKNRLFRARQMLKERLLRGGYI